MEIPKECGANAVHETDTVVVIDWESNLDHLDQTTCLEYSYVPPIDECNATAPLTDAIPWKLIREISEDSTMDIIQLLPLEFSGLPDTTIQHAVDEVR